MPSLLETVRSYVQKNGLPAAEEFIEFAVYMSALKDVATDMTTTPTPQLSDRHAIEPDPVHEPSGSFGGVLAGMDFDRANLDYRNCLRVTSAGTPRPDVTMSWPTVIGFPEAYGSAWLDPNLMTDAQALELGYPKPGLAAAEQARPYIDPEPTIAFETGAPVEVPEDVKAKRSADLQRMVAQDRARTSASRRFQRSEAAGLLSSTVRVDQ